MFVAIVILALSIAILIAGNYLVPLLKQGKTHKHLSKDGVEAMAVLLNMQQTGLYVNNLPQVKLQIQVQPRNGRNFVTETKEVLSFVDLAGLHIGGSLVVKYNPSNVKEVMLVREANN